jgi:hypothetical protein
MRIWLIGADVAGSEALQQLKKNPTIDVVVSDVTERPRAVLDRIIVKVDYIENVTPLNINQLARRVRADLILIDTGAAMRALGRVSGGKFFAQALQTEMAAAAEIPCLVLQS